MNKKIVLMLLFVITVGAFFMGNLGETVYAEDGLYENLDSAAEESGDSNFISFRDNYEIDSEKISFFKDPGAVMLNMATNFIFTLQKDLSKLLIILFNFSMETNLTILLEAFIEPFISGMKNTIFDRFALFMIAICAFWFLIRMATNRQSQIFSSMVSLVAIIVLSFAFYAYPVQLLDSLDSISTEISNAVMDAPYDAIGGNAGIPNKEITSTGKSAAVIWNVFVHKPWQIIEFGSTSKAQTYENAILKNKPGSEERKEVVNELAEKEGLFSKSLSNQTSRCITSLILLIINFFLIAILALFCLLILGYQFLLLIYMMLGIFVFLLALIPYYGFELVKRWGMKLLATACMKVLLVFFLSLLMVFMTVIYGFTDQFGLLCTLIIIVVMTAMIYLKKDEIVGLFAEFSSGSINLRAPEQMVNNVMDQDFNPIGNLRNTKNRAPHEYDEGGFLENTMENKVPQAPKNASVEKSSHELKAATDNMTKSSQNINDFYVKAENLLQKSYEQSKAESEEKATRSGLEVEYGNLVKRTDAIREMGIGNFDSRDLTSVASLIQSVEQKGGDINKIIDTKSDYLNKPKIQRPQGVNETSKQEPQEIRANINQASGASYFKNTFGEEKGEMFYENMKKKYRPEFVETFTSEEKLTYSQIQNHLKTKTNAEGEDLDGKTE